MAFSRTPALQILAGSALFGCLVACCQNALAGPAAATAKKGSKARSDAAARRRGSVAQGGKLPDSPSGKGGVELAPAHSFEVLV